MAEFNVTGLDELLKSLEEAAEIPDDVVEDILSAQADVIIDAQKAEITSQGLIAEKNGGQLLESIGSNKKLESTGGGRYMEVYPQGVRSNGVRNAEVGFILEYGAEGKHIPAHNWMSNANEKCAEKVKEAGQEVYNRWLDSKNL